MVDQANLKLRHLPASAGIKGVYHHIQGLPNNINLLFNPSIALVGKQSRRVDALGDQEATIARHLSIRVNKLQVQRGVSREAWCGGSGLFSGAWQAEIR